MSIPKQRIRFLREGQGLSMENLPNGAFFSPASPHDPIRLPFGSRLVRCDNTGDFDDPKWENPISGKIHHKHPLGEKFGDTHFEWFYEITPFEGPPFEEGDDWDHETNTTVRVEKPERTSVWNAFRQRWEPQCTDCLSDRIKYDYHNEDFDIYFTHDELHFFFDYYCNCCVCKHCQNIHTHTCREECRV